MEIKVINCDKGQNNISSKQDSRELNTLPSTERDSKPAQPII